MSELSNKVADPQDLQSAAIATEDNVRLDEVLRGYRVLYLSEKNFIKRTYGIDSIRIYDKSLIRISKYGDEAFTRERNRLIRDGGYLTYKEQMKELKNRGIWSEKEERQLMDMRAEAREVQEDYEKLLGKIADADGEKVSKQLEKESKEMHERMAKLHTDLMNLAATQINYFRDTIEMKAQFQQQLGWVVSSVCKNEGEDKYDPEKRIWNSIEALEDELNDNDLSSIISECVTYWDMAGMEAESFFAESPEELMSGSDGDQQKS